MADTFTTTLNLTKPEVGASNDSWGTKLNDNLDDLDALFDAGPVLKIAKGGTGASTAGGALTALGAQAADATLTSLAALGTAADKLAYTTGVDTWAETAITSFGRSLIDDADAATARTTLGLGDAATGTIGSTVQAYDADLAALAGVSDVSHLTDIGGLSLASGDILYANATPAIAKLAKGTDGQVLTLASGLPSWADAAAGGGISLIDSGTLSGSASTFTVTTSIGSTARRLLFYITGLQVTNFSNFNGVVLGDSGGFETSGYNNTYWATLTQGTNESNIPVAGGENMQSQTLNIVVELFHLGTNKWFYKWYGATNSPSAYNPAGLGYKQLSGNLDRIGVSVGSTETLTGTTSYSVFSEE